MRRKKSFWVAGILIGMLLLSGILPLLADEEKKDLNIQPQKVIVTPKESEGEKSLRAILKIIVSPHPSFKVKVWVDKTAYYIGEKLTVYFQSTKNCYLTLFDFTPEGEVYPIFPNHWERNNYIRAGEVRQIPASHLYPYLKIGGPPGEEIIKAIATATNQRLTPKDINYGKESFPLISKSGKDFAFELKVIVKPIPPTQWAADTCYFYVLKRKLITGKIRVESEPTFAKVYLDGRYEGRTNKTIPSVTPGRHTIKVVKTGYSDWSRTVYVREGETVNLFAELKPYPLYGSIYITSTPWGARVFIDGVEKGETPLTIKVETGRHEITLIKEYYYTWIKEKDVYPREEVRLDVDLEPIPYKH